MTGSENFTVRRVDALTIEVNRPGDDPNILRKAERYIASEAPIQSEMGLIRDEFLRIKSRR